MGIKTVYRGSNGPFEYDDTDLIVNEDGLFPGETFHALITDGKIATTHTPTSDYEVMRKVDVESLVTATAILAKLLTVDGVGSGLDADKFQGLLPAYFAKQIDVDGLISSINFLLAKAETNRVNIANLYSWQVAGVSGAFTSSDNKQITVIDGIITGIAPI